MKNRSITWITIKFQDYDFDVKWSINNQQIEEIRSVDSEINISSVISLEIKNEIQNMIMTKGAHHAI